MQTDDPGDVQLCESSTGVLKEKYIFPKGSKEVAKKQALFIMSNSFRGWKGDLFRGHVQKGTKPDWKYFPNQ
jgi:hypothetical protein